MITGDMVFRSELHSIVTAPKARDRNCKLARRQPAIVCRTACCRSHPQMRGELRPTLVHVGGAATVVGLQAVGIGLGPIGGPHVVRVDGALHLVDLLVVLVGPHVGGEGGGQGAERHPFEAIAEGRVTED